MFQMHEEFWVKNKYEGSQEEVQKSETDMTISHIFFIIKLKTPRTGKTWHICKPIFHYHFLDRPHVNICVVEGHGLVQPSSSDVPFTVRSYEAFIRLKKERMVQAMFSGPLRRD